MRPSDYSVIEEALASVGVRREHLSGTAEQAIRLEGGTVLRFDPDGFYLGATAGEDPFRALPGGPGEEATAPLYAGNGRKEDGTEDRPAVEAVLAPGGRPSSPAAAGAGRPPASAEGPLGRLSGLLAPGGPVAVDGDPFTHLRNFSGAESDVKLMELWLGRKSTESRRAYVADLTKFFSVVSQDLATGEVGVRKKALGEITLSDLHEFAAVISDVFSERTQLRMLAAVKSLFTYANRVGYIPFNVGAAVELPSVKDDRGERELSEEDVRDLVRAPITPPVRNGRPDPDWKPRPNAYRDHVMLLTLYAGGLRREDVCRLKWKDVRSREDASSGAGQITVFGKGRKTGTVLLPPSVFRKLGELRYSPGDPGAEPAGYDAPVFASRKRKTASGGHLDPSQVYRIVKAAAKDAGLKNADKVSPHWLRHAHATHADRKGAPIGLIAATLRHSSISTTGGYLQANPSESSALYLGL